MALLAGLAAGAPPEAVTGLAALAHLDKVLLGALPQQTAQLMVLEAVAAALARLVQTLQRLVLLVLGALGLLLRLLAHQ
jgi:hypothetical protein